jgi:hypothetical protein
VVQAWLPRIIAEGSYRHRAPGQAHDVFTRLVMDTIRRQAQDLPLTYRYFADDEAAVAWLRAQQARAVRFILLSVRVLPLCEIGAFRSFCLPIS